MTSGRGSSMDRMIECALAATSKRGIQLDYANLQKGLSAGYLANVWASDQQVLGLGN